MSRTCVFQVCDPPVRFLSRLSGSPPRLGESPWGRVPLRLACLSAGDCSPRSPSHMHLCPPPALPAGRLAPSSRLSVWHGWESPRAPFCLSAPAPAPASLLIPAPVPTPAPALAPCRPGPQGCAPPPPPPWACRFSKLVSRFTFLPPRGGQQSPRCSYRGQPLTPVPYLGP